MTKKTFAILIAVLTFVVGVALARISLTNSRVNPPFPGEQEFQGSTYRLTGPYQYENLTIFLVHGPDQPRSPMFTPLAEALERKLVIVHETSDVNELAIENVSSIEEVFVQAGDIVKGGQQDRVLAVDLILPTNSGRIPISAFCVEHGRWTQRGAEPVALFDSSKGMIATKELKLATKHLPSQAQVWREVDVAQQKLSAGVNEDVRSNQSASSLQLAMESSQVQESSINYENKLSSIVESPKDVIGFVFAINDKLNSADVYASNWMFKRFWPKLLKTAAIEAVAERPLKEKSVGVSIAGANEFLNASERGAETINEVTTRTHMLKREFDKGIFFETRDMARNGCWIHRNYLTK
jgi:ARG/rhodanese/phosphatase superfamily protein